MNKTLFHLNGTDFPQSEFAYYIQRCPFSTQKNQNNRKIINQEMKKRKKEIDALGRMMINLEDIKEFYTWSQK